jgi:hypothetical protein
VVGAVNDRPSGQWELGQVPLLVLTAVSAVDGAVAGADDDAMGTEAVLQLLHLPLAMAPY